MAALALVITHTSCTSSETDVEGGDQIAAESGDLADNTDPDAMLDDGSGTLDQASSPETVGEGDLNDP
ncbi:MAG: hypothetical protein KDD45_16700, partial [Bdellovibrionales bacterium]|nr:hypothetical protein [Bdellovibrionales bacterium]